jgi:hypothetical protein
VLNAASRVLSLLGIIGMIQMAAGIVQIEMGVLVAKD